MPRSFSITKFLSGILLLIFALSITPKRLLHDLFAKHIDSRPIKNNAVPHQLASSGFNCVCDHLVAESAFVHDPAVITFPIFPSFSLYISKKSIFLSVPGIYSSLRGPPVTA